MKFMATVSALALAFTMTAAGATQRGYEPTKPVQNTTNNYGGKGGSASANAKARASANAKASSWNKNTNTNRNTNTAFGGKGGAGGAGGQGGAGGNATGGSASSSSSATGGSASANNSFNYSEKRQAPGFALGGGSSTAPCQGYAEAAASFPGGGFGFGFSRTVKFCKLDLQSDWLAKKGYRKASVDVVYCGDRDVRRALNASGYKAKCD